MHHYYCLYLYIKVTLTLFSAPLSYLYADPRGTGSSFISYGQCPIDDTSWSDNDLHVLALSKLFAFDYANHGQFFWNFRTELEPRWSFLEATAKGWMPKGPIDSDTRQMSLNTCNALLNPPLACGDVINDNDGFVGALLGLLSNPSLFIFGGVFVIVGALYALKYVGLGGKNSKSKGNRGVYTIIPDETVVNKSMESMKEMQINTNIESDKNSGGIDMSSDSIRSTGTTGSGSSVEMVVDSVIMSGRSGWSDSDVYSPISTSLTST